MLFSRRRACSGCRKKSAILSEMSLGETRSFSAAVFVALVLACCKDATILPRGLKWQMNAYTNWNLILIAIRVGFGIREWDPFLCVNSVGIFVAFKTAFSQGLDDNIRKKLSTLGLPLPRPAFVAGDFGVHFLPAASLLLFLSATGRRIPPISVTHSIFLSTWFAFRQCGKLDASDVYVPHPWVRGWVGAVMGMASAPLLTRALADRKASLLLFATTLCVLPYLSTRLDPSLKKWYGLDYLAAAAASPPSDDSERESGRDGGGAMPRTSTWPCIHASRPPPG